MGHLHASLPDGEDHLKLAKMAFDTQDYCGALFFASQSLRAKYDYIAWKYYLLSNCKIGNFSALLPIIDMLDEHSDIDLAIVKFDTLLNFRKLDELGDLVRAHFSRHGFDVTSQYFHLALGSFRASACPVYEAWLQELPPPAAAAPFWRLVAPRTTREALTAAAAASAPTCIYVDITGTIDHINSGFPMTGIQRTCMSLLYALRRVTDGGANIRLVYNPLYTVNPVCLSLEEFCEAVVSSDVNSQRRLSNLTAYASSLQELGVDYGWSTLAEFAPSGQDVLFFPDVFWGRHYAASERALLAEGTKTAFVIYDLIVLKDSEENAARSQNQAFANAANVIIRKADRIFVPSNATRIDVLAYAADHNRDVRVTTMPLGEDNFSGSFETAAAHIPLGMSDKRYVLSVGTLSKRKGFVQLARAFRRVLDTLPADVCLVFCGRWNKDLPEYREISELMAGAVDRIILVDAPSDHQLRALYSSASLFALISKDEGWGMPVSEALTQGTPLMLSDAGSLPEVAGEAALYVDPDDEEQVGNAILSFFNDAAIADELRQRQAETSRRSWDDTARKLIKELLTI